MSQLDDTAVARLETFETLLRDLALPRGFVALGDADRLFDRHVADSARAAAALEPTDRRVLDAGSGAGLPGIAVAIVRPDLEILLAEPRPGRAAFLELVLERLDLPTVGVHVGRVEDLRAERFDVAFARAFAPMESAWRRLSPLLAPAGRVVYFAGETSDIPDPPEGARLRVLEGPVLATWGPLIIMTR